MKKIFALTLVGIILALSAGCNGNSDDVSNTDIGDDPAIVSDSDDSVVPEYNSTLKCIIPLEEMQIITTYYFQDDKVVQAAGEEIYQSENVAQLRYDGVLLNSSMYKDASISDKTVKFTYINSAFPHIGKSKQEIVEMEEAEGAQITEE